MIVARRRVRTPKYQVPLVGAINGVNHQYVTPDKFDSLTIALYYNGQRLYRPDDFEISESLGLGTGYDTVTTVIAPVVGDRLFADYTSY